jgi:hypothetical protein
VVAFGLGDFCNDLERSVPMEDTDYDSEQANYNSVIFGSATQHVAFRELGDILQQHLRQSSPEALIERYAQEPLYLSSDKMLLKSIGIQALQDVEGLLKLDNNSAVFVIVVTAPIKQLIFSVCRPAMIIWMEALELEKAAPEQGLWKFKSNRRYM